MDGWPMARDHRQLRQRPLQLGQNDHRHRHRRWRGHRLAARDPESGLAISATEFSYKAPATGNFSHTITAASTGYTSATSAVSK